MKNITRNKLRELIQKLLENKKTNTEVLQTIRRILNDLKKQQKYPSLPKKFGVGGMTHLQFFEAAYMHWMCNNFEISETTLKNETDKYFKKAVNYVLSKRWYNSLEDLNNRLTIFCFLPYILRTKNLSLYEDYFLIVSHRLIGGDALLLRRKYASRFYKPRPIEEVIKLLQKRKIITSEDKLNLPYMLETANKRL